MEQGILLSGGADVDFMIHGVFSYELFGQTLWITTTHVCVLIVFLLITAFCIAAGHMVKRAKEVPEGFQNVVELIVEKLDHMTAGVMGKHAVRYRNYIGTIFIFILFSNFSGLFGLRPPTADYGVTFGLAIISFTLIRYNELKYQKLSGVLKGLCDPWPIWAPINIIGNLAVPISLSLRLFANILSGTAIMALIYALLSKIAYVWPAALHVYFDLFSGAIQTYVFCMLTMTYIADACGSSEP